MPQNRSYDIAGKRFCMYEQVLCSYAKTCHCPRSKTDHPPRHPKCVEFADQSFMKDAAYIEEMRQRA